MTIYQLIPEVLLDKTTGIIIRQIGELCLENPKNKTDRLCLEFIKQYALYLKEGLFYYGDPAGRHGDTRTNQHDYDIVDKILRRFLNNRSCRVPYKHPPVIKRRDFANAIFEGNQPGLRFEIDPSCKNSIADFEYLREDLNGKKLKEKAKDDSGRQYEKYGHTSDSYDYFICEAFARRFERMFT